MTAEGSLPGHTYHADLPRVPKASLNCRRYFVLPLLDRPVREYTSPPVGVVPMNKIRRAACITCFRYPDFCVSALERKFEVRGSVMLAVFWILVNLTLI